MRSLHFLRLTLLCILPGFGTTAGANELTYADLVERLYGMKLLATPPEPGEKSGCFSSRDRASRYDEGEGKYIDWHANRDGSGFLDRQGTMMQMDGPGVIWRIWSARPEQGHLKIFVDGAETPVLDRPFASLFDTSKPPFDFPELVHVKAKGHNTFIPIPFQKSIRIVGDKGWGQYYQITYTQFPEGTTVPSFTGTFSESDRAALRKANDVWGKRGPGLFVTDAATPTVAEVTLAPGEEKAIADFTKPGAITSIVMDRPEMDREASIDALRQLAISIAWDGESKPSVWSPLGDFFGTAAGENLYRTLATGMTKDGYYANWYMPYRSARMKVRNDTPKPRTLKFTIHTEPVEGDVLNLLRYHCKWHRDDFSGFDRKQLETQRWPDWPVLKIDGAAGRFCGFQAHMWNPNHIWNRECRQMYTQPFPKGEAFQPGGRLHEFYLDGPARKYWWGEGDEKFFVDGEKTPSTFGTGTEDYFGYAWGTPTAYDSALQAQPRNGASDKIGKVVNRAGPGNIGHITMVRWQIPDNVPFQKSFEATIEKYHPNQWPLLNAYAASWYQTAGTEDYYEAVPASERTGYYVAPTPRKPEPRVEGKYEGESLKVRKVDAGQTRIQEMGGFSDGSWSGNQQLLWVQVQNAVGVGKHLFGLDYLRLRYLDNITATGAPLFRPSFAPAVKSSFLAMMAAGSIAWIDPAASAEVPKAGVARQPVEWVNPLVDTHNSRWFYFNSACRPFGMVNLSPDTRTKGSWSSGYLYGDKHIRCFSHVHAWQLSGIPVLPITGPMIGHQGMDAYRSEFSHDDEVVRPGYHKVVLRTYGVTAELTSTLRVGLHRYTFPAGKESYVLFDVGALLGHGPMVRAEVRRVSNTEIEGMSLMAPTGRRRKETPVYFVAQFSEPLTEFGGWRKGQVLSNVTEVSGADIGAYVRVAPQKPLLMKVAISYTSVANARRNLAAELNHWDFDRVVKESTAEWNTALSRIEIEGGTDAQRTKFYTDLWRAMLGRRVMSDADGSYMDLTGPKPQVRRVALNANGQPAFNMHNFDAWFGTHWSLNILWPLLCPERYHDLCETSLEMFRNGGLIPRGPSGGNYTFVMIGDSAAPVLTAAYHKGIRDFDASQLLRGLVRNTEADGGRYYGGYATAPAPKVHAEYESKGYVSWGTFLGGSHNKAVSSFTLYNAYHDWCIAQLAHSLGETNLAEQFMKGAGNWRNVIWPEKQCAWVRLPDGSWKQGFKPVDEAFEQDGFCEASAAMTTFFVPHDAPGLAEHLGGADALAAKLDEYFQRSEPQGFIAGKHSRSHASVFVDYSNQDSTGMAHFFNRIGHPWLAQKWVRKVHEANFSGVDPFSGYNGDEDQGQMGSLSALMAMGLFQFDGGSGPDSQYDLTAPIFDRVTIRLSDRYYGGKTFTIVARNQAPANIYIQSAKWNGQPWNRSLLPHSALTRGGTLELVLGPKPNKQWGVE